MDVDLAVGGDRLTGEQVAEAVAGLNAIDRAAVRRCCTAGTTNLGIIDDLSGIGEISNRYGCMWMAPMAVGLAAPSVRDQFLGIELRQLYC